MQTIWKLNPPNWTERIHGLTRHPCVPWIWTNLGRNFLHFFSHRIDSGDLKCVESYAPGPWSRAGFYFFKWILQYTCLCSELWSLYQVMIELPNQQTVVVQKKKVGIFCLSGEYGTRVNLTVFCTQAFRQRKSLTISADDSFLGSSKCLQTGTASVSR